MGLASAFVDVNEVLGNRWFKGWLQLAAHSAFDYRVPAPIFKADQYPQLKRELGGVELVAVDTRRAGLNERGEFVLAQLKSHEKNRIKFSGVSEGSDVKSVAVGGYVVKFVEFLGKDYSLIGGMCPSLGPIPRLGEPWPIPRW